MALLRVAGFVVAAGQQQTFNCLGNCQAYLRSKRRETAFYKKRDRVEIIVDVLSACKNPRTQSAIRNQTYLSFAILQKCIGQLMIRNLLETVEDDGRKRLVITEKGVAFLEKYAEIERILCQKYAEKHQVGLTQTPMIMIQPRRTSPRRS